MHKFIYMMIMATAAFIILSAFIAIPTFADTLIDEYVADLVADLVADTLTDERVADLIRKDFETRRGCYLRQGECNLYREKSREKLVNLNNGVCPYDGSELLTLTLPNTMSYIDTGNIAYFCARLRSYWVLHTQGAFQGSVSYWLGSFRLEALGPPIPLLKPDELIPAPIKPLKPDELIPAPIKPLKPDELIPAPIKPLELKLKPGEPIPIDKVKNKKP